MYIKFEFLEEVERERNDFEKILRNSRKLFAELTFEGILDREIE